MDINNINSSGNFGKKERNMESSNSFINSILTELSTTSNPAKTLDSLQNKDNEFKKKQHGLYKYKNYYIFYGAREYFENDIEGYKIAEKTRIKAAPVLVKKFNFPEQEVAMVLQLPCADDELLNFNENIDNLSLVERLHILNEFKKMLNCDYINIGATNSTKDWRLTPDHELVLLLWDNLAKVTDTNDKYKLLDEIKKHLKISNNNPENTYFIY